ncbi:lysozyme inhibitor LprI family protein [Teredinibacter haidensis]|uniref:lysozyme inhibitor LprI family protein n=1 Tax=Teredinibacter haidensis TaxID=2731755 RepID=UPI000A4A0AD4|nr:lysozyme inhibitor LprI family protein [Teredinibacter haidensis]
MKNLAFVFLMFTLSSVCCAEPYLYEDGAYKFKAENIDECYGLGTSSPILGVCQKYFRNLAKNKLDTSYNNLLSKLTRDKSELIAAQLKWEEFSNLQCQFEAKASEANSKPSKVYFEINNICMDNLRVVRAGYLDSIDTGCAGCVQ